MQPLVYLSAFVPTLLYSYQLCVVTESMRTQIQAR